MTQSTKKQQKTVYIGGMDLSHDAESIKNLLREPGNAGIVVQVAKAPAEQVYIYRPTTPLQTEEDVTREMRKFLVLIAVYQGNAHLTTIKDNREKPKNVADFNRVVQQILINNPQFKERF